MDVQEYIVPSILFPYCKNVCSEHSATKAFKLPCHGAIPIAPIAVPANINGTFPIYPAIITIPLPAAAIKYPEKFNL